MRLLFWLLAVVVWTGAAAMAGAFAYVRLVIEPHIATEAVQSFINRAAKRPDLEGARYVAFHDVKVLQIPHSEAKWEYILPKSSCITALRTDGVSFAEVDVEAATGALRQYIPIVLLEPASAHVPCETIAKVLDK